MKHAVRFDFRRDWVSGRARAREIMAVGEERERGPESKFTYGWVWAKRWQADIARRVARRESSA